MRRYWRGKGDLLNSNRLPSSCGICQDFGDFQLTNFMPSLFLSRLTFTAFGSLVWTKDVWYSASLIYLHRSYILSCIRVYHMYRNLTFKSNCIRFPKPSRCLQKILKIFSIYWGEPELARELWWNQKTGDSPYAVEVWRHHYWWRHGISCMKQTLNLRRRKNFVCLSFMGQFYWGLEHGLAVTAWNSVHSYDIHYSPKR